MPDTIYLIKEINKSISVPKKNYYWHSYNRTRIKRFLTLTLVLFIFQYLTTIQLGFAKSPLPLYPPIGIAFVAFYLFGNRALLGLLLGGFAAYFLRGLPLSTVTLYLMNDLLGGYIGTYLCQSVFSSDIKPFEKFQEFFKFLWIIALMICPLSSAVRITPLILTTNTIEFQTLFFYYINLWLSDLNAIIIFSAFLFSWITVPFSREAISRHSIKLLGVSLIIFIIFSLWYMRRFEFVYVITSVMLISLALARVFGYLVAMLLLFTMACLYLAYSMISQQYFLQQFGIIFYTFVPIILFIYTFSMIYISTHSFRHNSFIIH